MGQMLASRFMSQSSATNPDNTNNTDATWWCKLLAKVIAVFAGLVSLISGLFVAITASPLCILSGLLMMVAGGVVLIFEAPMCCMFLDFTKPIAAFAEKRTFFQKAIIYAVLAIVPFTLCFGLTSLFGCGLVFAAGVFYGLMGLGRKADRDQMMATAASNQLSPNSRPDDTKAGLIDNQETVQYPVRP